MAGISWGSPFICLGRTLMGPDEVLSATCFANIQATCCWCLSLACDSYEESQTDLPYWHTWLLINGVSSTGLIHHFQAKIVSQYWWFTWITMTSHWLYYLVIPKHKFAINKFMAEPIGLYSILRFFNGFIATM